MNSFGWTRRILPGMIALWGLLLLPRFGAAMAPAAPAPERQHLVLFHFNDLHGNIAQLARIATLVRAEREHSDGVLLLCAGDNFSGNPAVDQADPRGEPVLKLLNELSPDAMVLGNHEFDYGQDVLRSFIRRARFPILCANLETPDAWEGLKASIRLPGPGKTSVLLFGLLQIEPDSHIPSTHPSRVQGLTFPDPLKTAQRFRGRKPAGEVWIALSHLGYATDRELAEAFPELDVIVGGHSHTLLETGVKHNGVLIVQAGAHGDYLGRVDLVLRDGRVVSSTARLIPLDTVEPAADIQKQVQAFEANPVLQRLLVRLPRPLENKTELGNWICDMLRRRLDLDVAFQNSGGVRVPSLRGEVRLQDIYRMLPFENLIVRMDLYPREIRNLVAVDVSKHGKVDLLVSGLRMRVTRTAAGKILRIDLMDDAGNPLDEQRRYRVGFNSYIASSYRFEHADPGKSLEVTTAASVIAYLESGQPVVPADPGLRVEEEVAGEADGDAAARCEGPLEAGRDPYAGSSSAGNLAADAMRAATGGDVALFPSRLLVPGVRVAAGAAIGRAQMRALYRHGEQNGVRVARLSVRRLREFLLERLHYRKGVDVQISGLICRLVRQGDGTFSDLECRRSDGSMIPPDSFLRVAFCDYDYDRYYRLGTDILEPRKESVTLEKMLLDYLRRHPRLDESVAAPRWLIRDAPGRGE